MRLHILEGDWEWKGSLYHTVKLFSKAYKEFTVVYSKVNSEKELYRALSRKDECDVYYFSFHGDEGILQVGNDNVKVQNIFRKIKNIKDCGVHFASCTTLKGLSKKRYRPSPLFLSGYAQEIDWFYSLANDITLINALFLHFLKNNFKNIKNIMYLNKFLKKSTGFVIRYRYK